MSIIRVRKDARYFTASNEPFVDEKLSWEARGLMGYLLTKPDNWQVRTFDLTKKGPAKEHKVRRMLAELRKAGYMNRIRITLSGGKFDWVTEVYESPSQNPKIKTSGGFSTSGSSTSGKVPDIASTDSESTESTKERRKDHAPLPLDWQIASGQDEITLPTDEQAFQANCEHAVMNICKGARNIESLAMAFIMARRILPTKSQCKGWRSVFLEMYALDVTAGNITEAVQKLAQDNMTVVDPFAVKKTAIALAHPMPESSPVLLSDVAV